MVSQPTLDIFTGSETFGHVIKEQSQIIRQVYGTAVPGTSSSGRVDFAVGGATRIFLIQGFNAGIGFSGASQNAKLGDFIYTMEQWVNAASPSKQTLTDSFGVGYNVTPIEFTWSRVKGDPFRVAFSLIVKEGS